jgi:transcription antitermination factor NusG
VPPRFDVGLTRSSIVPWSLGITAPNREFVVASKLDKWGFPNHVFKLKRCIVHRGFRAMRFKPAFPGYVFLDPRACWEPLREEFGIIEFVRSGERVAELPETIVVSLVRIAMQIGDEADVLPVEEPRSRFCQGDKVLVRGMTLLAGQWAVYQHALEDEQAVVLIDWMGRWVPVALDERDLVGEQKTRARGRPRRNRRARIEHQAHSSPTARAAAAV